VERSLSRRARPPTQTGRAAMYTRATGLRHGRRLRKNAEIPRPSELLDSPAPMRVNRGSTAKDVFCIAARVAIHTRICAPLMGMKSEKTLVFTTKALLVTVVSHVQNKRPRGWIERAVHNGLHGLPWKTSPFRSKPAMFVHIHIPRYI